MLQILGVHLDGFAFLFIGLAEQEPAAHAYVIQHLQEPIHLRRAECKPIAPVGLPETLFFVKHDHQLSFVFLFALGERVFEQFLVLGNLSGIGRFADAMMRHRDKRVKPEHVNQQPLLAFADVENKVVPASLDQLHASRSIVACRLCFCS